jgi:ABC-type transport system substrate-binding protein
MDGQDALVKLTNIWGKGECGRVEILLTVQKSPSRVYDPLKGFCVWEAMCGSLPTQEDIMNWIAPRGSQPALLLCLILTAAWSVLATAVLAAEFVPPQPLPNKPAGGTLSIAYFREISSPDGFQASGSFDRMYFFSGNEVLVAMGKDGLYDPAQSLAYAFEILDDGKRYRFHLRKGVQFQENYGEMTAADVAWSLNRIHRQDTGSRFSGQFRAMDRAEEVDRYTVDVILKELDANLIFRMFDRASIVHSPNRWEEVGGAEQHKLRPIGTGPYQLVDWKVGIEQQWVKHPQYWRGEPMADRLNVKIITENRARLAALQTGEVQVAWLQAEQVHDAQKDPNIKVWSFAGVGWDGWAWADGLPPLDDLRLRRAMVKAVDRDALNKAVYLNTMRPSQAHTFAPESPFGINAEELWQGDWLKYDPAAAKKLVREVAKDKGLKLPSASSYRPPGMKSMSSSTSASSPTLPSVWPSWSNARRTSLRPVVWYQPPTSWKTACTPPA